MFQSSLKAGLSTLTAFASPLSFCVVLVSAAVLTQPVKASGSSVYFTPVAPDAADRTQCGYDITPTQSFNVPSIAEIFRDNTNGRCETSQGCKTYIVTQSGQCSPIFFSNKDFHISRIFGLVLQRKYGFGLNKDAPFVAISSESDDRQILIVIQDDVIYMF